MAGKAPEIVETVVAEIVDEETFQQDCKTVGGGLWLGGNDHTRCR
jgi:hypothetical protein